MELSARHSREAVLKKAEGNHFEIKDCTGSKLSISRAKSALQLERNNCLRRVSDLLKKQDKAKSDAVEIAWQVEGSKTRQVKLGSVVAFVQEVDDSAGKFVGDFCSLRF